MAGTRATGSDLSIGIPHRLVPSADDTALDSFASELAREWRHAAPDVAARRVPGTLVFADISGFTRLTERLAAHGRYGAEEISDHLDEVLSALLAAAYQRGAWLVKWGGDALLLMFEGPGHVRRACSASAALQSTMRRVGGRDTSVGHVRLRMSIGVHTGIVDFALLGQVHRELIVTGRAATLTARLEAAAEAGDILLSPRAAAALPASCRGARKGEGVLLARPPDCEPPEGAPHHGDGPVDDLLPELVLAHLAVGGGSGEHRPVAIGFVEFSGLARLRRRAGTNGVLAGLSHVVEVAQQACHRNHVSFHETDIAADGGKFMLVAGAPLAVEDPAEAMLCATRQILDDPGPLQLRAGVTLGRAFTGVVGPPFRRSYSVKGDVVNLAARIMGKAPPGGVWALPAAVEASRTRFTMQPVPAFRVKGKSEPVTVCGIGSPLARARTASDLPLIGRDVEVDALESALREVRRGAGRCIELVGEPGSGKTRLLNEALLRAGDMTVLSVAGEPFRGASPYAVVRSLLLAATGLGTCSLTALPVELRSWVRAHCPALEAWLPLLGTVVQTTFPDTPETADLALEFRGERLREVIVDLLAAAAPGPTVLTVDDLQFADAASREALDYLTSRLGEHPWLVVFATRVLEPSPYSNLDRTTRIVLPALTTVAAEVLVCADTDDAPLPPHVLRAVVDRGAGNPLFLRQLAQSLLQAGVADLPDSVETVLGVRIDQLHPRPREVLRAAAVLGMHVHRGLLAQLVSGEANSEALAGDLGQLGEFLEPDGVHLRFRQAIVREAAYDGLPFRRRADLHARLAKVLDARAGDSDAGLAVRAMHHFHAGHDDEALQLSWRAADRAAAAFANVEAVALYERALASARRLPGTPPVERADLFERLGDVQLRLGEFAASDVAYTAGRRLLAADPVRVARIGLKMARSASQRGDFEASRRRLRRTHRLVDFVDGPAADAIRLECTTREGFTLFRQGRLATARVRFLEVVARGEAAGQPDVLADALGMLDVIDMNAGIGIDGSRSRRALRLYLRLAGLAGQARMLNQLGYCAYFGGRWDDAITSYRQAQRLYERLGDLSNAAINDANVAEILVDQGRLEEAEVALTKAVRVWRAARADNEVAFGFALLGRVHARQGRFEVAEEMLSDARRRFQEQGARGEVVDADAYLAECLLLSGHASRALELAQATLQTASRLSEQPAQAPLLYRVLAASHDALGDMAAADAAYEAALDLARRRKAGHELALTVAAMADRQRRTGKPMDPALIQEAVPLQRRLGVVVDLSGYEDQQARPVARPVVPSQPGAPSQSAPTT